MVDDDPFLSDEGDNQSVFSIDEPKPGSSDDGISETGVIQISGKKYAVNLNWDAGGSEKKNVKQEASSYDDADLYCIRNTGANNKQWAFGGKDKGHKPGMLSLASAIAGSVEGNWIGGFVLEEGCYLIAVREGSILSDFDSLYDSVDDAQNKLYDLFGQSDWDTIVAPEDWGVTNTHFDIEDLIDKKYALKLKLVNPTAYYTKIAVFIAAIGASGYMGYDYFLEYRDRVIDERTKEASMPPSLRMALDAVDAQVEPILGISSADLVEEEEVPPDPPWKGKGNGAGVIISCTEAINDTMMNAPGWRLTNLTCNTNSLDLTLERADGKTRWVEEYFQKMGYTEADLLDSVESDTIYFQKDAPFVTEISAGIETRPLREVERELRYKFDDLYVSLGWEEVRTNINNDVDRYYRSSNIDFSSQLTPDAFLKYLINIPALVINNIEYSVETGEWGVSATIYEKRQTPLPKPESD